MIHVAECSSMKNEKIIVYVDGSSRGNPGPAGIGVAVFCKNNLQRPITEISQYIGITTNNVAEYEALIHALTWLSNNQFCDAEICLDSELVYKQLMGDYRIKNPHLQTLVKQARVLLNQFSRIDLLLVPRQKNRCANKLAQKSSAAGLSNSNNIAK